MGNSADVVLLLDCEVVIDATPPRSRWPWHDSDRLVAACAALIRQPECAGVELAVDSIKMRACVPLDTRMEAVNELAARCRWAVLEAVGG